MRVGTFGFTLGLAFGMLLAPMQAWSQQASDQSKGPVSTLPSQWAAELPVRSIGPANMSGRIVDLAINPQDPMQWWAATASGGLLRTDNNGATFTHQFDKEATVSIGAIDVAPSDPKILWVGTGEENPRNSSSWGDGVYKSVDGGETWTNMGLRGIFQTGAVLIHPQNPDVVFVGGLGRLWGTSEERGLFKTIDGGKNWKKVLYVDDRTGVMDVVASPADPNIMLAATYTRMRDGFDGNDPAVKFGPGAGIWRSTDGGETWTRVTEGLPKSEFGRVGLCFYEKEPNFVYAIVESKRIGQMPEDSPYLGIRGENAELGARMTEITKDGPGDMGGLKKGDVVLRVDDKMVLSYNDFLAEIRRHSAGETVTITVARDAESVELKVELGKRPNDQPADGRPNNPRREQRTEETPDVDNENAKLEALRRGSPFAQSLGGQNPNFTDQQGKEGFDFGGVYRSTDAGVTWERINTVNPRPMYYSKICVDPSDNNYIWVLGTELYLSEDGGKTFRGDAANSEVHTDHHAMWIDPTDGRHVILGCDGGIYVTHDRGKKWDHHNHVAIGQFYHVGLDTRPAYNVYGGLQDNGSWGGPTIVRNESGPVNTDWFRVGGGDGFVCLVDPNDPNQIYFESQNGAMGRRNLATGESGSIRPRPPRGTQYRFNWKTPFILSPHNSTTHYSAGNYVFRSVKKGDSVQAISPEVTRTSDGSGSAIGQSPVDEDVLYVGTTDGMLWATLDGGKQWVDLWNNPQGLSSNEGANRDSAADQSRGLGGRPATGRRPGGSGQRSPWETVGPGKGGSGQGGSGRGRGGEPRRTAEQSASTVEPPAATEETPNTPAEQPPAEQPVAQSEAGKEVTKEQPAETSESTETKTPESKSPAADDPPTPDPESTDIDSSEPDPADEESKAEETGDASVQPEQPAAETSEGSAETPATEQPAQDKPAEEVKTEEVKTEEVKTAVEASPDSLSGTWSGKLESEMMPAERSQFRMAFKKEENGKYSGEYASSQAEGTLSDGSFDEASGQLSILGSTGGANLVFTGTLSEGKLSGNLEVNEGAFSVPFTATRSGDATTLDAAGGQQEPVATGKPLKDLLSMQMWVSSIEPSKYLAGRCYVTFDGHRSNVDGPFVLVTEDNGKTWTRLDESLPPGTGSARVIREDLVNRNLLYLGTEFGLFISIDRGATWTKFQGKLPTVAVHEVAQHPTSGEIVIATHGRSLWIANVTALRQWTTDSMAKPVMLYKPAKVIRWQRLPQAGDSGTRRFVGENPSSNAQIFYSLAADQREIELEIRDITGRVMQRFEVPGEKGLHAVDWDLRRRGGSGRFASRVENGEYLVALIVDGQSYTQTIRIASDPEFSTSGAAENEAELLELLYNVTEDGDEEVEEVLSDSLRD